jgi:hypothetical protein
MHTQLPNGGTTVKQFLRSHSYEQAVHARRPGHYFCCCVPSLGAVASALPKLCCLARQPLATYRRNSSRLPAARIKLSLGQHTHVIMLNIYMPDHSRCMAHTTLYVINFHPVL